MRVLIFALMLVLVPLRGWMGDAMATGMAMAEVQALAESASGAYLKAGKPHPPLSNRGFDAKSKSGHVPLAVLAAPDCAGHAEAQSAASGDSEHCTPCSACGACHSASMSTAVPRWAAASHAAAPLAERADAFFSADTASFQKPPIS